MDLKIFGAFQSLLLDLILDVFYNFFFFFHDEMLPAHLAHFLFQTWKQPFFFFHFIEIALTYNIQV